MEPSLLTSTEGVKFFKNNSSPRPKKSSTAEGMVHEVVDVVVSGQLTPEQTLMNSRNQVVSARKDSSPSFCQIS